MTSEKKILVISHNSFSNVLNNGKTFESMFKAVKQENLAQLFFSENEDPDFDFCSNYFKITDSNVLKSLLAGYVNCGNKLKKTGVELVHGNKFSNKIFNLFKKKAYNLIFFRDMLWKFNSWKSEALLSWVDDLNPDLIFYVAGNSGFSHDIARFIANYTKVPLLTFFTDDYILYPKYRTILQNIQKMRMSVFYKKTINQSVQCFAIGELMAKEYSSYFKKNFIPIMNSTEPYEYVEYLSSTDLNFAYFGGLHLERWKMLARLANLLPSVRINVFSMGYLSKEIISAFADAHINFRGGVKGDELRKEILKADVLIHVESTDLFYRSLTQLSISTKIPEYLISGRPVLGFGPSEVASMRILSDNNIGLVVSSDNIDNVIKEQLKKLYDYHFRRDLGKRGHMYAVKNFDNKYISEYFKKIIETIVDPINETTMTPTIQITKI